MNGTNERNQQPMQKKKETTEVVAATLENQLSFGFSVKSFGHLLTGEPSVGAKTDSLGKLAPYSVALV
jgi:hypothetical protein